MIKQYLTHKNPRIRNIVKTALNLYEKKKYFEAWEYVIQKESAARRLYWRSDFGKRNSLNAYIVELQKIAEEIHKERLDQQEKEINAFIRIQFIFLAMIICCLLAKIVLTILRN